MQETRRAKGAETKDALLPSLNASSFEVSSTLLISGSKTVSTKWTMLCIEQRQKDICTVTSTMEKEDTHRGKKASQASQGEQWQKNVCMVTSTTEKKTHTEEKRRVKQVWENNAKKRLHGDKYNGKRRHTQGKKGESSKPGRATPKKLLHGDKYDGKRRQDTHRGERRVKQAWENNRKKTCAR
jgi:hypothetical protein